MTEQEIIESQWHEDGMDVEAIIASEHSLEKLVKKHREPEVIQKLRRSGFDFGNVPQNKWTFEGRAQI